MSYLTTTELNTHIYGELSSTISRGDDTILQTAIDSATEEARGYLSAYDTNAIFIATGAARNPVLLLYIKDIAVWHFVALCNAGIELSLREDRYNKAIAWLQGVQSGNINPTLPLPAPPSDGSDPNNFIKWGSANPARNSYF